MNRKRRAGILSALFIFSTFSYADANPILVYRYDFDVPDEVVPLLLLILSCIIFLVQLAARTRMLKKCGENGVKILVPFYGRHTEYRTYWKTKYFWINLGLSIYLTAAAAAIYLSENRFFIGILTLVSLLAVGICLVNIVRLRMNILNIFGCSRKLAFLELIGMGFILDFILGFSGRQRIAETKADDSPDLPEEIHGWE